MAEVSDPKRHVRIGQWETAVSCETEKIAQSSVQTALSVIRRWSKVFPYEKNGSRLQYGVPSIIASMNCVADSSGGLKVISISGNPSSVGIACVANERFKYRLSEWMSWQYSGLQAVYSSLDEIPDDKIWIKPVSIEEAKDSDCPMIIRSKKYDPDLMPIRQRSLTPAVRKNDNAYGIEMKLWKEVSYADLETLPWNSGFALRSMSNLGRIYLYNPGLRGQPGISSDVKIERILTPGAKMYLQEFVKPMENHSPERLMVYKLFFGYDRKDKAYVCLGGVWMARENYLIHGTPETIYGPLA